jgi:hypothetical protein
MTALICSRCKRRNVIDYEVPEDVKRAVLLNRWKSGVCPACFDELAEQARVTYSFEQVRARSWSDRPVTRNRALRRR